MVAQETTKSETAGNTTPHKGRHRLARRDTKVLRLSIAACLTFAKGIGSDDSGVCGIARKSLHTAGTSGPALQGRGTLGDNTVPWRDCQVRSMDLSLKCSNEHGPWNDQAMHASKLNAYGIPIALQTSKLFSWVDASRTKRV